MSSEEQKQILKMVEEGKISADEAVKLIKALEENQAEDGIEVIETEAGYERGSEASEQSERSHMPEFEAIKARARRFAAIPLWIGIGITVLVAYWMFSLVQNGNYGFWFACAWFPLLFGILLIALSAGGPNARWLFLNVDREEDEWPKHITFGFPLPTGLLRWILRNFGHRMPDMDNVKADVFFQALENSDFEEPLIINVDEGDNGDRVQLFIG